MTEQCSICRHVWAAEIDRQLLQGVPLRTIAHRFDVGKSSLSRHMAAGHLPGTRPERGTVRDKEVFPGVIGPRWRN